MVLIAGLATLVSSALAANSKEQEDLLKVRESVWRTYFEGDTKTLEKLVPPDTITINSGEEEWEKQADVLKGSAEFKASGGKLIRLEFPRTEIQWYGNVAVTYSQYLYEIEQNGKRSVASGRVTEIFVRRDGHWTNPGWHTDAGVTKH
jgi:hypothetical protein